jgi:hypothetical protein
MLKISVGFSLSAGIKLYVGVRKYVNLKERKEICVQRSDYELCKDEPTKATRRSIFLSRLMWQHVLDLNIHMKNVKIK